MKKPDLKAQRLVALFLFGALIFNHPLLALFNRSGSVWGVPVLYAYLFMAWALFIGLAAIVVARSR